MDIGNVLWGRRSALTIVVDYIKLGGLVIGIIIDREGEFDPPIVIPAGGSADFGIAFSFNERKGKMKVIRVRHMMQKKGTEKVWIDEGGGYICETADAVGLLEGEVEGLLEEACDGILLTCKDMTEAEFNELFERGEFQGW